jgi:hypothetical protein
MNALKLKITMIRLEVSGHAGNVNEMQLEGRGKRLSEVAT